MKIFCYRDFMEGQTYKYFGVTLYFIAGTGKPAAGRTSQIFSIIEAIAGHLEADRQFDTGRAIERLVLKNAPIIGFVQMCIAAGTGKTRCYFDAKKAGLAIRKQTQLALYEYMKLQTAVCEPTPVIAPYVLMDAVREHFADQLETFFGGMTYETSPLSEVDETDSGAEMSGGDFVFEIGRLKTKKFDYSGHWHSKRWISIKMFDNFDLTGLEEILKRG